MYDLKLTTSHVPAQSDMETREITIGALLREVAAARPEAEALVEIRQDGSEGRRWTYAGLLADAERLAMALSTRFAPGERVVIWSPNSPEWVLMECACALSGLALAFGMAVDNSIVLLDNVALRAGPRGPRVRVLAAIREVLFPLLAATATTAVVTMPFLYLDADLRDRYLPFVLAVVLSLLASLVIVGPISGLFAAFGLARGGAMVIAQFFGFLFFFVV